MNTIEFEKQLQNKWGKSSIYCTAYQYFRMGFKDAWSYLEKGNDQVRNATILEAIYITECNRLSSNGATMTIDSLRALLK